MVWFVGFSGEFSGGGLKPPTICPWGGLKPPVVSPEAPPEAFLATPLRPPQKIGLYRHPTKKNQGVGNFFIFFYKSEEICLILSSIKVWCTVRDELQSTT